jgi:hypothetical protein
METVADINIVDDRRKPAAKKESASIEGVPRTQALAEPSPRPAPQTVRCARLPETMNDPFRVITSLRGLDEDTT